MMFLYLATIFALHDEEQLLRRAQNSLKETNGFLISYQKYVRFDPTYYRLDQIIHKLRKIETEFNYMLDPR